LRFENITIPQSTQTFILSILQMAEESLDEGVLDDARILAVEIQRPLGDTYVSIIGNNEPDDDQPIGNLAEMRVNLDSIKSAFKTIGYYYPDRPKHIDVVLLRALYLAISGQDVTTTSLGLAREVVVTDNYRS